MSLRIQFFLLLSIVVLNSVHCNAPRNNPSDPLNPDYNYGSITGTVQTTGNPSFGLTGVNILWENANLTTRTDANGKFTLNNIPIKNGNIIFFKEGFKSDTLFVIWGGSDSFITLTFLNRIPVLDTISIYTVIEHRQTLDPESKLIVKAWITDLDGDVDSVFVLNTALNLKKPLVFTSAELNYQASIPENELNVTDIEETIGLDFFIIAKDHPNDTIPGSEFIIGSERVTRVIKDAVTGLFPTDSTVNINDQPITLEWTRFDAGYTFDYLIEVFAYTIFTAPQLIYSNGNIPGITTSHTIIPILTRGNYYWVIWVVDQFQNRSRSKPGVFQVDTVNTVNSNFQIP